MGKKNRRSKKSTTLPEGESISPLATGLRNFAEYNRRISLEQSFARMAELDNLSLEGQKTTIRETLTAAGTDCAKNDADPMGNGDQSTIQSKPAADAARELYSVGGDIHQHAMENAFSKFGALCLIGSVDAARKFIDEVTKIISMQQTEPWYYSRRKEMTTLLETRDTSMRLSPLLLIVSVGKNASDQSFMDYAGVAKLLLISGASPDAKDVLGKTVCHYGAGAMATPMTLKVVDMCIHAARSSHLFGREVELHSLKANMNGFRGVVGGFNPDSGRRAVYLLDDKKEVWIKPVNIRLLAGKNADGKGDSDKIPPMLADVQDRLGSVSLHEVLIQNREDVAEFLLIKHKTSIHTEDMDGISPLKMSTGGGQMMASNVCKMITDVTRKEGKKVRDAKQATKQICASCQKDLGKTGGKKCTACLSAVYCGRDCQIAHWNNGHRAACKNLKKLEAGVKLKPPSGQYAYGASVSFVSGMQHSRGTYRTPDGVSAGEKFVVKVQGGSEMMPIMVYDESRTCEFTIPPGQPGFVEVLTEMKKEMAWGGRKTFMKASFDESGCTIYPSTAGVKSKYSW